MRIAVALASRGRPSALIGVIMSAWRLQSGRHELCFVVGNDEDDTATQEAIDFLRADTNENVPVVNFAGPKGLLIDVQNRLLGSCRGSEVVTLLSDRSFPITHHWDDHIAVAATQYPKRLAWWSCPHDPDLTMPIIPEAYAEAVDWEWCDYRYPFWMTDTHNVEIDGLVARGAALKASCSYAGFRAKTTRGRDFEFWIRLFIALRPKRIEQAEKVAERLGIPWEGPLPDLMDHFKARDEFQLAHAADFEQRFGDPNPPTPEYLQAKERAEQLMKELGE